MSIKYSDLTSAQRDQICNGCGKKGGIIPVPEFIFTACCNQHDFKYWRGHGPSLKSRAFWRRPLYHMLQKRLARKKADIQFFMAMSRDAESLAGHQNKYFDLAHIYFEAVRKFGWCAFNWGKERTIDDITT